MHTAKKSTPLLTRRQFLRVGLAGGAVLLTARLVYGPFARMRLAEVPEAEQLKTLNPRTAALACTRFFDFSALLPCHYRTFPPLVQDASAFVEAMGKDGAKVRVPDIGGSVTV